MGTANTWTAPYLGTTHLETTDRRYRSTVVDRGSFAELSCWFPGCGFSPKNSVHADAVSAKQAGEQWLRAAQ